MEQTERICQHYKIRMALIVNQLFINFLLLKKKKNTFITLSCVCGKVYKEVIRCSLKVSLEKYKIVKTKGKVEKFYMTIWRKKGTRVPLSLGWCLYIPGVCLTSTDFNTVLLIKVEVGEFLFGIIWNKLVTKYIWCCKNRPIWAGGGILMHNFYQFFFFFSFSKEISFFLTANESWRWYCLRFCVKWSKKKKKKWANNVGYIQLNLFE